MAVRVAINGFGRIGRNVLRAIIESGRTDIEVVAINDLGPVETNAHLLRFDSVHGRFPGVVTTTATTIDAGRGPMEVTAIRNPADLPWGHVDIVMECTGIFTSKEKCAAHLENGAKRVLISAPGDGAERRAAPAAKSNLAATGRHHSGRGHRAAHRGRVARQTNLLQRRRSTHERGQLHLLRDMSH